MLCTGNGNNATWTQQFITTSTSRFKAQTAELRLNFLTGELRWSEIPECVDMNVAYNIACSYMSIKWAKLSVQYCSGHV